MTAIATITMATAAKKAVIGRLRDEADGGLLSGVDVSYAYHGKVGAKSIYGGGWRFTQQDAVAETPGILVQELVSVSLYVRVLVRPGCDVEQTDEACDGIAAVMGRVFQARPRLTGDLTCVGVASGQGDYSRTDDETISIHGYQVQVAALFGWGH